MVRPGLLFVFVLTCTLASAAQNLDSLENSLAVAIGDQQASLFKQLAEGYSNTDWEKALKYAEEYQKSVIDSNQPEFQALLLMSKVYRGYGNYGQALEYGKRCLSAAQSPLEFGEAYFALGEVYEALSEFQTSLDYHFKSMEIWKSVSNDRKIENSLRAIAFIYKGQRQFEKAIEILKEARQISYQLGDTRNIARATFNIGLMTMEMDRHADAIPIFREAMQGMNENKEPLQFSMYYNNLANCYQRLLSNEQPDYYDSALFYGRKNLILKKQIKDLRGIANAHNNLAATFERASEWDSSYYHSKSALHLADSLRFLPIKKNALMYLLSAEIMKGRQRPAFDHFDDFIDTYEELSDQANSRNLSEMTTRYETEKKEAENAALLLENRKQYFVNLILLIAGAGLVALTIVLLLLYKTKKKSAELLARDKETIQSQAQQLRALNDLKSHFFANISHELRTPLTLIQGNADDTIKMQKLPLKAEDNLRQILRSTRQLNDMVNDLLDLSRLELNQFQVEIQPANIDFLLGRICASFSSLAESKNISLKFTPGIGRYVGLVDPRQFERVVNNLIYNAFKFTSTGGSITVSSIAADHLIYVTVQDTGLGIPEADLPFIFDRFYQGKKSKTIGLGTGLGLAIAKELVALMKGQLQVKSQVGIGSTFTVQIPASETDGLIQMDQITDQVVEAESPGDQIFEIPSDITILIVEDNPDLRDYLVRIMADHFKLIQAENGAVALTLLQTAKPDLILTDLMMPEMDGWTLIERLKAQPHLSTIPVILLTAIGENESRLKGLRLGVDDYLLKPFESEELLIRITNTVTNLRERIRWAKEFQGESGHDRTQDQHELVLKIREFVLNHLTDKSLNVLQLALHLGMSERQLYRKTTEAVGMQPARLITEIKLQHARELLLQKKINKVAQVAQEVGFDSASHFSKLYFQRFGKKPNDYFT